MSIVAQHRRSNRQENQRGQDSLISVLRVVSLRQCQELRDRMKREGFHHQPTRPTTSPRPASRRRQSVLTPLTLPASTEDFTSDVATMTRVKTESNVYDSLNRLIERTVTVGNSTTTHTAYIHDGSRIVGELDIAGAAVTTGGVTHTPAVVTRINLLAPRGELLSTNQANSGLATQPTETLWAYADQSGTVTTWGRFDANGDIDLRHERFDTFGHVTAAYGSTTAVLVKAETIFQGMRRKSVTELFEANGRLYDPVNNRFTTQGPVSPESPNPYLLGNNDPLNKGRDWSGIEGPDPYSNWLYRGVGEANRVVMGDQFLMQDEYSAEWAFGAGFVVAALASLALAPAELTLGSAVLLGGAAGAIDYATTYGVAKALDRTNSVTWRSDQFATYMAGGAIGGGVFHGAATGVGVAARGAWNAGLREATFAGVAAAGIRLGVLSHEIATIAARTSAAGRSMLQTSVGWARVAYVNARAFSSRILSPRGPAALYWHGTKEGVEAAFQRGLFAHGTGSGSKFWATNQKHLNAWTEFLIGGNTNIDSLIPFRTSTKGGFQATYRLTPDEAHHFRRAWGVEYSWNPYQWYKGAVGQFYYHPGIVSWAQRGIELGRAAGISTIIGGGVWGGDKLLNWRD